LKKSSAPARNAPRYGVAACAYCCWLAHLATEGASAARLPAHYLCRAGAPLFLPFSLHHNRALLARENAVDGRTAILLKENTTAARIGLRRQT